jgi:hypothetical protein
MMRATKATIPVILLLLGLPGPASAKMPCPEVLAGVEKAGKDKTPEDVATELGIPPRRVRACLRKNGAKDEEGNPIKGLRRAKREGKTDEEGKGEAAGAAKPAAAPVKSPGAESPATTTAPSSADAVDARAVAGGAKAPAPGGPAAAGAAAAPSAAQPAPAASAVPVGAGSAH